jgi:hypothetical protein
MKKQNANNKLAFGKATVTELNETQLQDVNGGTTPFCVGVAITLLHSTPAWTVIALN